MVGKDRVQQTSSCLRSFLLVAAGSAALMAAGCETFKSHQDEIGRPFEGEKNKGETPDCYKGTGKGPGQFGTWKLVPDAPEAPASGAFDILLGDGSPSAPAPDPNLLLRWGGGGDAHNEKDC